MASKYFTILILTITLIIPFSIAQCNTARALPFFRRSVYEFTIDLVTRIAQENDNHFISSGLSPYTLLSAISLGASDTTLVEFEKVLRLHHHKCFNNKYFEIIQELTAQNDGTTLERSSSIFADNQLPLKDVFVNRVKRTKVSDISALPFENYEEVARTINDYVSIATHGTIEEIVDASDLESVYLIMIDALYFKGTWKSQFGTEDTEISAFYDEKGNQIGDVNLMFIEERFNLTEVSQIDATVLELPYGKNGRFSMLFILPKAGSTVSSVLSKLKSISLSTIFSMFKQRGSEKVLVQIPRFKISSDLNNLKELLTDMGLTTMFESSLARFSDISDYKLYISNFIQKASVEVNEEGTEASAVSSALFEGRSLQVGEYQFNANKPFLFMIVDRELELALFTGAYSKPSVY